MTSIKRGPAKKARNYVTEPIEILSDDDKDVEDDKVVYTASVASEDSMQASDRAESRATGAIGMHTPPQKPSSSLRENRSGSAANHGYRSKSTMSVVSRLEDADSRSLAGSRNADEEDEEDEDMADRNFEEDDSADEDYQEDDGGDDMSLATNSN